MKIRAGFVSNSSSSSFVCEVSGYSEVVEDGGEDSGFLTCTNDHTFLKKYLVETPKDANRYADDLRSLIGLSAASGIKVAVSKFVEMTGHHFRSYRDPNNDRAKSTLYEIFDTNTRGGFDEALGQFTAIMEQVDDEDYSEIDPANCPICTMTHIRVEDMVRFLLLEHGGTKAQVSEQIRNRYLQFNDFMAAIKQVK